MCGIAGIISKDKVGLSEIQSVTNALSHRGPDAQATFMNDACTVAMGHTRLSVIDLSVQANQPMHSSDGRNVLVFNGEIYNFRDVRKQIELLRPDIIFQTQSDTEVILNAFAVWGVEMIYRLEGMFAFVVYDQPAERVFLFRDRIGKKPLHYFSNHRYFIFASEIKSLLNHSVVQDAREIDSQAVNEFLHLGYIPEPRTIYKTIKKFPAGCVGELHSHDLTLKLHSYWKVEDQLLKTERVMNETEAKSLLKEKLHNAVKKRLISDVPLGAFLSGGTDSSLITAIASEYTSKPIKTFSIGLKESAFDEHLFAQQVAGRLKTDHHEYILAESEATGMLEKYLAHFDEPFADTSAIPTMLVSQLARKQVTVALTGDGGDELFLGYGSYSWAKRLNNPIVKTFQRPAAYLLDHFGDSRFKRISHLFERVDHSHLRSHIFSQEQYFFSQSEILRLLNDKSNFKPFLYYDSGLPNYLSEEDKQALFDLKYYLKDDLLVKVDRASMLYALECRSPFLDQQVVEYAVNLPDQYKTKGTVKKWILKELLKEYLPSDLVDRPKWGFSIPLSKWMKNEFRYLIDDYLNRKVIEEVNLVNVEFVEQLKVNFFGGHEYLYNRIWILVILHKWMKEKGAF